MKSTSGQALVHYSFFTAVSSVTSQKAWNIADRLPSPTASHFIVNHGVTKGFQKKIEAGWATSTDQLIYTAYHKFFQVSSHFAFMAQTMAVSAVSGVF